MDIFVARQPIFDRQQKVFGYELLHRSSNENTYNCPDGDRATSEVILNSFLVIGLDTLTGGKKAFINFTKNMLENESAFSLPEDLVVVEVLENVLPDDNVLDICKKLREKGYCIALDDFNLGGYSREFWGLADIVKVCFLKTSPGERKAIIDRKRQSRMKFLAEKLETQEDFEEARNLGYDYFQGYFFSKPVVIADRNIKSFNPTYLHLLHEIYRPDLDYGNLEKLIKQDVALSYKLLKYINSLQFGFVAEIHSIRQALAVLGLKGLIKWAALLALRSLGSNKPDELLVSSVCRANFCEYLAPRLHLKERSSDFFLMGLFSQIDAFLDRPMDAILEYLPMSRDVKEALLGKENVFLFVHELMVNYERGDWEGLSQKSLLLNLGEETVANLYLESLKATNTMFTETK